MSFIQTSTLQSQALSPAATPYQQLPVLYSRKADETLHEIMPEAFNEYATPYPVNQNSGIDVIVQIPPTLSPATTKLTDSQTAKNTAFTFTNAKMTLGWYGNDIAISKTVRITAMFVEGETYSEELSANAVETLAYVNRAALDAVTPTAYAAGSFATLTTAMRTLKTNKVRGIKKINGRYAGIIGPYYMQDIMTEGGASYASHYYTTGGSDILAEGMLSKDIAGIRLHVSTVCKSLSTEEYAYFFGDRALATVGIKSNIASPDGQDIDVEGVNAMITNYLLPAKPSGGANGDVYGTYHRFAWLCGLYDVTVTQQARVVNQTISEA